MSEETYKGKPIVDVEQAKDKTEEVVDAETSEPTTHTNPSMFFTVTTIQKGNPVHVLVRSESIIDAAIFVHRTEKFPIIGVHITEYSKYYDVQKTTENTGNEDTNETEQTETTEKVESEKGE